MSPDATAQARSNWDRRYAEAAGLVWGVEPNRFLVAEVGALPPGRALDLACGEGRNAVWLAERGWTVTGVDFSTVALATGAAMAEQRGVAVEWVPADVTRYDPDRGGFDLVIVFYLQLHDSDLGRALRAACDGVAPGGTLLVVGHDVTNLEHGHGGPRDPDVLLDADRVVGHLDGLLVERAERVLRPVPGVDVAAIDTLVRARRAAT